MPKSQLYLSDFYITHNNIRDVNKVKGLVNKVNAEGYFANLKLFQNIKVADFGDKLFIRDGLHRCLALYILQKDFGEPFLPVYLVDKEYYTYEEFEPTTEIIKKECVN